MDLKSTDIVVIGAFNPAIISPVWLFEQGIVPAPSEPPAVDLELGARPDFVFRLDDCLWKVSPDRLLLEPQTAVSPVAKIKKVLATLSHTPVRAVGFNFHFHCAAAAWKGGHPTLGARSAESLSLGGKVQNRVWSTSVSFDEGSTLNLSVRTTEAQTLADFNFHRATLSIPKLTEALDKFDGDMTKSRTIVAQLSSGGTF